MKHLATVIAILCSLIISSTAFAKHHVHYRYSHHFGRYLAHRHFVHHHYAHLRHFRHRDVRRFAIHRAERLPSPCRTAASMGGPCGCWTDNVLEVSGTLAHVWRGINLWLANDWLRFPHVPAEQATAAVWPGRHVAPIVAGSYRDGSVIVRDYWGTHRVRTAGLIFVDPHAGKLPTHRQRPRTTYRVAGGWPL